MLVAVRHLILQLVVRILINIETCIDLDSIIDNSIMNEEAEPNVDSEVLSGTTEGNNNLLAYMAGQQSSSGDIRQVLAEK